MKVDLSITSLQNAKIKLAAKLKDRSHRDETGLFLIEGYREVKRAADGGITIQSFFVCPELFLGVNERDLIQQVKEFGAVIYTCPAKVFEKLSYRDRPDGLIAIAVQMKTPLAELQALVSKKKEPFIIIAEGIEKPGNLGSILRSADGVGADAVVVCDRCTDIYNPNVIRSSIGTLFTIPVIEAKGGETLFWLQKHKIKVVASSPTAQVEFTEADLRGPIAIVVGTEQLGLSELWMHASDIQVSIPMKGVADSLNVATAASLLMYEVLRQRKKGFPLGTNLFR
ncbi:MAG: RNA methyltransferase [Chlamydiae bacterium]|nr:RNA methyltransferase [Chlamydiota bacterium]